MRTRLSPVFDEPEVALPLETQPVESDIETTQDEIEAFLIVKTLLRGEVSAQRIAIRDAKSYCAVLLDDNNRKPLARLRFNAKQKYVGLFDTEKEERVAIDGLDDIFGLSERLVNTVKRHEQS